MTELIKSITHQCILQIEIRQNGRMISFCIVHKMLYDTTVISSTIVYHSHIYTNEFDNLKFIKRNTSITISMNFLIVIALKIKINFVGLNDMIFYIFYEQIRRLFREKIVPKINEV